MIDIKVRALYYLYLGIVPKYDWPVLQYVGAKFDYCTSEYQVIEHILEDLLGSRIIE